LSAARGAVAGATGSALGQYENVPGYMELTDVTIQNTVRRTCGDSAPSQGLGDAIVSRGELSLVGFLVESSENVGLVLGSDGAPDLVRVSDGTIRTNRVGLSLLFDPPELSRITTRVRLVDNGVALDSR
jgi:hypothetical protein